MNPHKQYQKVDVVLGKDGKISMFPQDMHAARDIPLAWGPDSVSEPPKLEAEAWYDPKQEVIGIKTDIVGQITHEFIDLKDDAVRQALISAGWTPPSDN